MTDLQSDLAELQAGDGALLEERLGAIEMEMAALAEGLAVLSADDNSEFAAVLSEVADRQQDILAELSLIAARLSELTTPVPDPPVAPELSADISGPAAMPGEETPAIPSSEGGGRDGEGEAVAEEAEASTRSFGEEMVLRLYLLVGDIKRGIAGE